MMRIENFLPKTVFQKGDSYFLDFEGNRDCIYSGKFLGSNVEGVFVPSLMFLEIISDRFGEIVLNKKNSWLFSCNRIITDSVKDSGGEYVIVRNGYSEILGVAKRSGNKFFPVWDIGHLLRREIEN